MEGARLGHEGRVGPLRLHPGDRIELELQLASEAHRPPPDPDEVPALELAGQEVGVAEGPSGQRAGAVAELEREVRDAVPGGRAVLAGAGEDAVHPGARAELGARGALGRLD